LHSDALVAALETHRLAALIGQTLAPGCSDVNTSWEHRDKAETDCGQFGLSELHSRKGELTRYISRPQESLEDIGLECLDEGRHQFARRIVLVAIQNLLA
jgi:hypothetical protein